MAQTTTTAGDATTGLIQAAGDDGTYVIKTGAAGLKVNAVSYAADGTPTQLKGTTIGSAPMAVPSGSAPMFACRAWCNFDGSLTGTNAPRAGGNVTSVTRTGTGQYTVNFTTAMPDANYAVLATAFIANGRGTGIQTRAAQTTASVGVGFFDFVAGAYNADTDNMNVAIFR